MISFNSTKRNKWRLCPVVIGCKFMKKNDFNMYFFK